RLAGAHDLAHQAVGDDLLDLAPDRLGRGAEIQARRVLVAQPHDARFAIDDDRTLAQCVEALEERLLRDLADRGGILEAAHYFTTDLSLPKRIRRPGSVRGAPCAGFTS